jgi:hypothetical protein
MQQLQHPTTCAAHRARVSVATAHRGVVDLAGERGAGFGRVLRPAPAVEQPGPLAISIFVPDGRSVRDGTSATLSLVHGRIGTSDQLVRRLRYLVRR